jgi:hypothetical protein
LCRNFVSNLGKDCHAFGDKKQTREIYCLELPYGCYLLLMGIFSMNSPDLRPDRMPRSHWARKIKTPFPIDHPHNHLREKILAEDKKKRYILLFSTFAIIMTIIIMIAIFSFKMNVMRDSTLINNIDLLTDSEEIAFYHEMEFYQWLDLVIVEENQLKSTLSISLLLLSFNDSITSWTDLTSDEKKILEPYAHEWDNLTKEKQSKLSKVSQRWLQMSPKQKRRLKKRLKSWKKTKPEIRQRITKSFHWYQRQSINVKQQIQLGKKWFYTLNREQRKIMNLHWVYASKSDTYPLKTPFPLTASTK